MIAVYVYLSLVLMLACSFALFATIDEVELREYERKIGLRD